MSDFAYPQNWPDWDLLTNSENELPGQTPGMKLELKSFDIRENSKGDMTQLQTGTKKSYTAKPNEVNGSAMVVQKTYYGDKTLKQTELVIHSPYIIEAIRQTVKTYPNVNIGVNKITIVGPLACLFHYRKELADYGRQLQDITAAKHLAFALSYMGAALADDIAHYKNCAAKGDQPPGLDFDRLWMEYRPGELIYVRMRSESWIGRLVSMTKSGLFSSNWSLRLQRIELIGEEFSYAYERITLPSYGGFKRFKDQSAFPLRFHPDHQSIKQIMIARGKAFHALRGVHHRFYSGIARWASDRKTERDDDDDCHFENFQVKSRVIIDNKSFIESRPDHIYTFVCTTSEIVEEPADAVCDENFMICQHEVFGFSLTDKRWCAFNLDYLHDIHFNAEAFHNLLLPDEQKETLLALAKTHTNEKFQYDDFIAGKGRGLIILLHGDPGLGKTLTAESTADYIQRPLYPVRSGDLGIDALSLEKSLADAFSQAAKWNAIILLDEADVFLEARQRNELQRNSLVSIFLRILEYYQGLMFLTTNRIESFDPAFKSRIHLTIKYHALSPESKRILWRSFITNGSLNYDQSCLEEEVLDELAATHLNGRQIRNMVRTSYAIAASTGSALTKEHLRRTLRAMIDFESELSDNLLSTEDRGPETQVGPNKLRRLE